MKKIRITIITIICLLIIALITYLTLRETIKTTYKNEDIRYIIKNPFYDSATVCINGKGEIDFDNVEIKQEIVKSDDPRINTKKVVFYKLKNKTVIYYYVEILEQ